MFVRPASLGARVSRGSVPHTNRLRRFYAEWQAMKRFRSLPLEEREIVFYAETKADWVHFAPIIRELTEAHDKRVCYLTSDHEDSVLEGHHPNILPFGIGSGAVCTILFRALEARVMVITLTDLDAYHLKRSAAYPVHYVYVFHSMVSSHMVFRPKAYDAYDTILCVGPHHTREIRRNEALHGLRPKRLIEHGYGRLDAIVEASRTRPAFRPSSGPAKSVLIAPSWGADSITATCADELIAVLLSAGHGVTFRPHPMSVRQQKPVIDRIRSKFGSHPRFSLELDVRSSQSLHDADVMISDWSGAALEFALGLERPVLFIDTPRKVNNRDYARLQCEPLEVLIRPQVGVVVSPQDLGEIPSQVATLCAHRDQFVERIREARARWIYNLGSSGRVGATAVLDALESTRNGHPRP